MNLVDADALEEPSLADPPRTLIEATYRQLRRAIIEGRHAPGEKLRVEHLKSCYDVSSSTLREALGLLISDALVISQGQRGFRVAPMSLADLEDLTRLRILLECEALRESIARGEDDWEAGIVSAFHKLSLAEQRLRTDPPSAFDDWEACNRQFHEALVSACESTRILKTRRLLYQQAERYRRLSVIKGPPPREVHDEHRAIFKAVLARKAEVAVTVLTSHIHRAHSVIKRARLLG